MQMADEIPEGSWADAQKPARSSKLLGMTHEFICGISAIAMCGILLVLGSGEICAAVRSVMSQG